MNKDLKKGVEALERGVELADEERMHGRMLGQAVIAGEDAEEKRRTVMKLKGQLKVARGISIVSLFVLIVVLLYACAAVMAKKPINQSISSKTLSYRLEVPEIDTSRIRTATLEELVSGLSGDDFVDYLGFRYHIGDTIPSGVFLRSMSSLEALVAGTNRAYVLADKAEQAGDSKGFVEIGCSVHRFRQSESGSYQELPSDFYYDKAAIGFSGLDEEGLCNYLGSDMMELTISVYEDADIESLVSDALQNRTYGGSLEGIGTDIADRLQGLEFSIECGDYTYSTYDSVEEQDGYFICFRGTESVIPEMVVQYDVEVRDYDYNLWVCIAQEGWY